MQRAATERVFEIIREAMVRSRERDSATWNRISEAQAILAFRSRFVYGYDLVDDEVVWNIVRKKVSRLLEEVDVVLRKQESLETDR